jgi:hypothetical protein
VQGRRAPPASGSVRGMRPAPAFLLMTWGFASLVACGDDDPAVTRTAASASFDRGSPTAQRVFEAYRSVGVMTEELTFPRDSREIRVTMDCAGSQGDFWVEFETAGGAGVRCTSTRSAHDASVILAGDGSPVDRVQTVTITGPEDQQWSVAIDAAATLSNN